MKSIFKIFVWTFLGPWMKLVDIFYVRHKLEFEKSEEELKQDLADDLKEVSDQWSGFSKTRRIVKEKLMKDRVIREYMYGKVSFFCSFHRDPFGLFLYFVLQPV